MSLAALAVALCLSATGQQARIDTTRFTLAWEHTVERVRWEEDYLLAGRYLVITGARIMGSGAGMEPPADAVLHDGAWRYRPRLNIFTEVVLARAPVGADHELCLGGRCGPLSHWIARDAGVTTLTACAPPPASATPSPAWR